MAQLLDAWPARSGFLLRGSASYAESFMRTGTDSWASWRRSVATLVVGRVLIDELAPEASPAVWPGRLERGGFPDPSRRRDRPEG